MEKVIRGWRVRGEGPGYMIWYDPSVEHVVLYDGPDLAYEVHEGRHEAGEAVVTGQLEMNGIAECDISSKREVS